MQKIKAQVFGWDEPDYHAGMAKLAKNVYPEAMSALGIVGEVDIGIVGKVLDLVFGHHLGHEASDIFIGEDIELRSAYFACDPEKGSLAVLEKTVRRLEQRHLLEYVAKFGLHKPPNSAHTITTLS
jgi:hypothetical protein